MSVKAAGGGFGEKGRRPGTQKKQAQSHRINERKNSKHMRSRAADAGSRQARQRSGAERIMMQRGTIQPKRGAAHPPAFEQKGFVSFL